MRGDIIGLEPDRRLERPHHGIEIRAAKIVDDPEEVDPPEVLRCQLMRPAVAGCRLVEHLVGIKHHATLAPRLGRSRPLEQDTSGRRQGAGHRSMHVAHVHLRHVPLLGVQRRRPEDPDEPHDAEHGNVDVYGDRRGWWRYSAKLFGPEFAAKRPHGSGRGF